MRALEQVKRPVTGLAGRYGHPVHPALVAVPIGAWIASFVFDIDISSINFERFVSIRPGFIVRLAYNARKAGEVSCVT